MLFARWETRQRLRLSWQLVTFGVGLGGLPVGPQRLCTISRLSPSFQSNVEEYPKSFMFALALHWGLEVVQYNLSEKGAEAAFALASVLSGHQGPQTEMEEDVDDESAEDDGMIFPWEGKPSDLPADL